MPTFKRCDESVSEMAQNLISSFKTHKHLLDYEVKIDFVFAYGDRDEVTTEKKNDALTKNGVKALGICRKLPLKDRAMGRADAEISIDGDWWETATDDDRRALLDHELHHIAVKSSDRDDLGRPKLGMRPHDFEFGWFKVIAQRHGMASQEQKQARRMMDEGGQFFWPDIHAAESTKGRMAKLEVSHV